VREHEHVDRQELAVNTNETFEDVKRVNVKVVVTDVKNVPT